MSAAEIISEDREEHLARLLKEAPLSLVASRIRRARRSMGLSHDDFGEPVGIIRQHLIGLEKGKHRPRVGTLMRIAARSGREPEWFVTPDEESSPFQDDGDAGAADA